MIKQDLINFGTHIGADHVVAFTIKDIVFDPRTILKCMFGCSDWGKGLTCPSRKGSLTPDEYRKIFEHYSWGLIVHSKTKNIAQSVSYELEREAYLKGYYFAFSLSDCALCKECAGHKEKECRHPKIARPAFHSVGIDIYKTVHKFDLPLKTLKQGEDAEQNWYSAVFVE